MEQKKHVSSSASRNLKSSFLVTRILCKNLNENCLSLLSLVESYMNENFFSHSECSSAKSIFQVLMPVGSSFNNKVFLESQKETNFTVWHDWPFIE